METIRNVRDLELQDRSALERVLGHQLQETQQVIVNVVNLDLTSPSQDDSGQPNVVPDHWKIYEGLSDAEVDVLDQAIRQRANLTRDFE